jgi:hypothetical protein
MRNPFENVRSCRPGIALVVLLVLFIVLPSYAFAGESKLPKDILPQTDLTFGYGGINFFTPSTLADEQKGYEGADWNENWLVIASDVLGGDPIFIDTSSDKLPVYTAMHGNGSWEPVPVADSWTQFLAALEFSRRYTKGREYPVGLENNPLSATEQSTLMDGLQEILGSPMPHFWELLFTSPEP